MEKLDAAGYEIEDLVSEFQRVRNGVLINESNFNILSVNCLLLVGGLVLFMKEREDMHDQIRDLEMDVALKKVSGVCATLT